MHQISYAQLVSTYASGASGGLTKNGTDCAKLDPSTNSVNQSMVSVLFNFIMIRSNQGIRIEVTGTKGILLAKENKSIFLDVGLLLECGFDEAVEELNTYLYEK
jgi:hypothetical protein